MNKKPYHVIARHGFLIHKGHHFKRTDGGHFYKCINCKTVRPFNASYDENDDYVYTYLVNGKITYENELLTCNEIMIRDIIT